MSSELPDISTVIVLGAGQAGAWAAASLRKEGFAGRVVMIGEEAHRPYERPPLSKAVLKGESTVEDCAIHPLDAFERQELDFRPAARASAIDLANRRVALDSGEQLDYDRLIITTGGRARTLPVPGGELPGVLVLRTLEDATALGHRLRTQHPVVVVGGGWIGLEAAAVAAGYGCPVTVVEVADRLCVRTVPAVISDYLHGLHSRHGVAVRLGVGVTAVAEGPGGLVLTLDDGSTLEAGTVIVGVGLIPNDDLAVAAGLKTDRGIVVDASTATSDPAVFAAGDVTVSPNSWAGHSIRLESWQNAQEQGIVAGRAALGLAVEHDLLPWFWSDQYDVRLQIYGMPQDHHTMVVRGSPTTDDFTVIYLEDDLVVAAIGPGAARDIRTCKRLIEKQIRVDAAAIADPAVPLPKK